MKYTRDSRKPGKAAAENPAVTGEGGGKELPGVVAEQSGAPRSWKQYIDQAMPVQGQKAEVKQEAQPVQAKPDGKEAAKAAWGGFLQKLQTAGKAAASALEAARGRADGLTAGGRGRIGQGAAKIRDMVARHPVSPLLYAPLLVVGIVVPACKGTDVQAY
ncbi:MAG: hypothetical protein K2K53_02085, partial [Oscillospiraceae bacterium]|nr:hypothetical protein [Oscillospiraceae bacterium]